MKTVTAYQTADQGLHTVCTGPSVPILRITYCYIQLKNRDSNKFWTLTVEIYKEIGGKGTCHILILSSKYAS